MPVREAACSCGQLRLQVRGDPHHVGICHCLACQRRTGSAFGMQAGFEAGQVTASGRHHDYPRISDEADRKVHVFHFCPDCGSTVFYTEPDEPDLVVVMVGAFADPSFPAPRESGYGDRKHPWVVLPDGVVTDDAWAELRGLYESGRYDEAVERGGALVEASPDDARLLFNVACCESLAGRTSDAIEHLRRAVDLDPDQMRSLARGDSDLDRIRDDQAFRELIG